MLDNYNGAVLRSILVYYPFTGLDNWTGILDWTTGPRYFRLLDKFLCIFRKAYIL